MTRINIPPDITVKEFKAFLDLFDEDAIVCLKDFVDDECLTIETAYETDGAYIASDGLEYDGKILVLS